MKTQRRAGFFSYLLILLCWAKELCDIEGKQCFLSPKLLSVQLEPSGVDVPVPCPLPKPVLGGTWPSALGGSQSFNKFPSTCYSF